MYISSCSDDDNRITLTELPSELTGEEEGSDYINAYIGDYINASYIDVRVTTCEMCRTLNHLVYEEHCVHAFYYQHTSVWACK